MAPYVRRIEILQNGVAAWQILCDHPQVCEDRIAIIGTSFGVFVALRIATSLSVNRIHFIYVLA
ncbi:acyl-coenzyme A thioesterase 1-like isoform X1 [Clarias magur]|uniref:Acyl-coenzyme A thioesterase 1-like isoform X1 n=1 Tax=Clarias magur TaxID=1594786 RepID=A0A8J4UNT5_CLAMG|nr:acyl-coenzyme A thioesterase 1-like isoform X1 [Clarias magur]